MGLRWRWCIKRINYVNDAAVVFANGKLDSNEYTRIGPLVAYIDADQMTVSVGQRILHEGTEVILGAVEFHRAQLPPPGTEPSAPYQILPSPDGTKPTTPGSTVASGSRLTTSVMLFALVVALIMWVPVYIFWPTIIKIKFVLVLLKIK